VALVRTDVSEELITSIIRIERISELATMLTIKNILLVTANVGSSSMISLYPEDGGGTLVFLGSVYQLLVTICS
jgi:hypothetical protein